MTLAIGDGANDVSMIQVMSTSVLPDLFGHAIYRLRMLELEFLARKECKQ